MEPIENTIDYTVSDDEDLYLSITYGDGQKGYSVFKNLDGTYVNEPGNMIDRFLGKGNMARNKKLVITTVVTDINENTNNTSVTFFINDKSVGSYSAEAESENSTVDYKTTIKFK